MLQTLVRGISSKVRNPSAKKKLYDISVDVNLPGISGILSSAQIGTMFAAELIDHTRMMWGTGRTITGASVSRSETAIKIRERHAATLATAGGIDAALPRKAKFLRGIIKHYTLKEITTDNIDGIRSKFKKKLRYIPDPSTPALDSSGLMIASVKAAYVPGRTRTLPDGSTIQIHGWLRVRVPASRQWPAFIYAGLRPENAATAANLFRRYPQNFRYTNELLKNLLAWTPPRKSIIPWGAIGNALQIVGRLITRF